MLDDLIDGPEMDSNDLVMGEHEEALLLHDTRASELSSESPLQPRMMDAALVPLPPSAAEPSAAESVDSLAILQIQADLGEHKTPSRRATGHSSLDTHKPISQDDTSKAPDQRSGNGRGSQEGFYPTLPESRQGSSQSTLGSSLWDALETGMLRSNSPSNSSEIEVAMNTPLPPSILPPSLGSLEDLTRTGYGQMAYIDHVRRKIHRLPHLKSILSRPRFDDLATLSWYDFSSRRSDSSHGNSIRALSNGHTMEEIQRVRVKMRSVPSDVDTRLFVATDLSLELIDLLGSTLDVSPECFAEHVSNSAYNRRTRVVSDPNNWMTSGMQKSYISVNWLRPVQKTGRSLTATELQKLVDTRYNGIQWWEHRTVKQGAAIYPIGLLHQETIESNIVRKEFPLMTAVHASYRGPSSWKERLTLWNGKLGGCNVGKRSETSDHLFVSCEIRLA